MKQWAAIAIIGAVLSSVASVQALTIYAAKDTYLDWDEYSENYGADDSLHVRKNTPADDRDSLLKFDLSSIPENAVITSAKLSLYYYDKWSMVGSDYLTVGIFPLLSSWTEGTGGHGEDRTGASWFYKYAYIQSNETWDAYGARGSYDRGALDAEIDINKDIYRWIDWQNQNVTDTIAAWYANPLTNHGWVMDYTYSNDNSNGVIFWSREATGTSCDPKLEVDYYIIPEPATLCLLGLGGLLLRKRRA